MPIPAAILTQLTDVLAEIYSDHTSACILAITAGLRVERIAVDARPVNYWAAVLEEAEAYGATQALLDRTSTQYPNHTGLATVAQAYMAWRLPPLPPQDLPDKPYRYLDRYHRADAEIFFAQQPDELADRSLRLVGVRDGAGRGVRLNLAPLAV